MIHFLPPKTKARCPTCQQEMPAGKQSGNPSSHKHSTHEDDTRQIVQEEIQQVLEAATQQVVSKAMESILPVLEKVQEAIGQMGKEMQEKASSPDPNASNQDFLQQYSALANAKINSLNQKVAQRLVRFQDKVPNSAT